jgi:hypothetical protein
MRMLFAAVAAGCVAQHASAHQLDEQVQVTRLEILHDRINVAMALSPGAIVAPRVLVLIDTDLDGRLSLNQIDTYAAKDDSLSGADGTRQLNH